MCFIGFLHEFEVKTTLIFTKLTKKHPERWKMKKTQKNFSKRRKKLAIMRFV